MRLEIPFDIVVVHVAGLEVAVLRADIDHLVHRHSYAGDALPGPAAVLQLELLVEIKRTVTFDVERVPDAGEANAATGVEAPAVAADVAEDIDHQRADVDVAFAVV